MQETNGATVVLTLVVFAILPAVYEEILFRGMYADAFSNSNVYLRHLIASLVFASAHSNYISITNAFFLGLILMLIYEKYKSIFLVILLHMINNICSVIFANYVALPFSALNVLSDYANDEQMWYAVIISVAIVVVMATVFILCIIRIKKYDNEVSESEIIMSNSWADKAKDIGVIGFLGITAVVMIFLKVY